MLGLIAPMPGVVECFNLSVRRVTFRSLEKDVVSGIRVERRIEIDKVDGLFPDVISQHLQAVAEVESVAAHVDRGGLKRAGNGFRSIRFHGKGKL